MVEPVSLAEDLLRIGSGVDINLVVGESESEIMKMIGKLPRETESKRS